MNKEYVFSTVFYAINNIHLIKDPGMIPLTMQRYYGFHSLVPLSSLYDYNRKNDIFCDIETPIIHDIEKGLVKKINRSIWIFKNAKKIDVLQLFFFDRYAFINIFLYKLFNKKGIVYVHCDTDGLNLVNYDTEKTFIRSFLLHKVFLTDDILEDVLWGIQNAKQLNTLKRKWPFKNIIFVPDGIWWPKLTDTTHKKDIILNVARVGTRQKRTDLLLDAFEAIAYEYPKWHLRIVGPIENDFIDTIDSFYKRNPKLKTRVVFTGPIESREELEKEYCKAKIFCFPSMWESFGISALEALSRGNYLICSDIEPNEQLTKGGEYGTLFKNGDLHDLIDKMKFVLNNEEIIENNVSKSISFGLKNFQWENVLEPVNDWIQRKLKEKHE